MFGTNIPLQLELANIEKQLARIANALEESNNMVKEFAK